MQFFGSRTWEPGAGAADDKGAAKKRKAPAAGGKAKKAAK